MVSKIDILKWMFFSEKIQLIFDIQSWLWKYDFGPFLWTVIHRRI
jgi:hypothetical protein